MSCSREWSLNFVAAAIGDEEAKAMEIDCGIRISKQYRARVGPDRMALGELRSLRVEVIDLASKINKHSVMHEILHDRLSAAEFSKTKTKSRYHKHLGKSAHGDTQKGYGLLSELARTDAQIDKLKREIADNSHELQLFKNRSNWIDLRTRELENEYNNALAIHDPTIIDGVRPCPSCRAPIMRTHGCNQMFCTICHTKFDWITGALLTDRGYDNPHHTEHKNAMVERISQGRYIFEDFEHVLRHFVLKGSARDIRECCLNLHIEAMSLNRSRVDVEQLRRDCLGGDQKLIDNFDDIVRGMDTRAHCDRVRGQIITQLLRAMFDEFCALAGANEPNGQFAARFKEHAGVANDRLHEEIHEIYDYPEAYITVPDYALSTRKEYAIIEAAQQVVSSPEFMNLLNGPMAHVAHKFLDLIKPDMDDSRLEYLSATLQKICDIIYA